MATELWAIGLVLVSQLIGAFGPIYLKKSSKQFGLSFTGLFKNFNLIIGVFFYGLATVMFIPALKGGELSVLYPMVSTVYVWVSLLSVKMLNEKMTYYKWLGVGVIIFGVVLIGFGSS